MTNGLVQHITGEIVQQYTMGKYACSEFMASGVFYSCKLDKSIHHFMDFGCIYFYQFYNNCCKSYAINVDPNQTPGYVALELNQHCLFMPLFRNALALMG